MPGHCLIVPMDHVATGRLADEQVWTEMRNFKKCLVQMYAAEARARLLPRPLTCVLGYAAWERMDSLGELQA